MTAYSILDLSPIVEGGTPADSFRSSLDLAQHAERWGYTRYWLAEHHNMPGIASAATSVVISHIAAGTKTIRVGSGGIMLPNHSPLVIAEQFGTLATLYGDRIDLGLGRAPGTDYGTARAMRRDPGGEDPQSFPNDVDELIRLLDDPEPDQKVNAIPGSGTKVPVYILGSSLFGAQLAAAFGLPYAFASHFAPTMLQQAVAVYRANFQPSKFLDRPYFMMAINVFAGETEEEGRFLKSSMQQSFVNLRTGMPTALPKPIDDFETAYDRAIVATVEHALSCSVQGTAASVHDGLQHLLARFTPDEVILNGQIHDQTARLRSFEIAAEVMTSLGATTAAAE